MKIIPFLTVFGLALSTLAHAADPLISQMAGEWVGTGMRHQLWNDRVVQVETTVSARVDEDGRLISENHFKDTAGGPPVEYDRVYWLLPMAGSTEGKYLFGIFVEGSKRPTAVGEFKDSVLEVEQKLINGNGAELIVQSRTEFVKPGETVYFETILNGDTPISKSEIHYTRK